MFRRAIVPGVLLFAACAGPWAPASAAPPTRKSLVEKLHKVLAEIHKLQSEELAELIKIKQRSAAHIGRVDRREDKMEAEYAKLRAEEWAELKKALDPAKAQAIRAKYAQRIADLEKQIRAKEEEMAKITARKDADLARIQSEWRAEIQKLDPPEDRLELRVFKLRAEERAELHKLIDPQKVQAIKAKFDPKIAELETKVKALEQVMAEAGKRRQEDKAKIEAALREELAKLDPPEDRLEDKLGLMKAQKRDALANATTTEEKKAIVAEYDPKIKALQVRVAGLEEDMALTRRLAKNQLAAVDAAYQAKIAKLDPPEDRLEDRVARLAEEERSEIAKLADPVKVRAIHARFDPQIEKLLQRIHNLEGEMAQKTRKRDAEMARVIAAWKAVIARLDPREDKLEFKLFILRAKEQAELMTALDPAKAAAIRAKFAPRLAELEKKIRAREEEMAHLAQVEREEIKKVIDKFNGKIAPLEKQVASLVAQIAAAKK